MRHFNISLTAIILTLVFAVQFTVADVLNVPDDFETIQAAIDEAEEGDTVLVDPGEYEENVNFNGNNIVVGSRFITTGDEAFISETIIDGGGYRDVGGGGDYSTVLFSSGESAEAQLIGFTIRNGYGSGVCGGGGAEDEYCFGGGIYCDNSSPTLSHLVVTGNEAFYGGGIFIWRADPALSCIVVSNNRAAFGGGVHIWSGNSTLDHLDIHDNDGNGSAMFIGDPWGCQETYLTLINSTISRNSGGSGTIFINSGGQVVLRNTIIWDNEGAAVGVYAEEDDGFSWMGVDFSDIEGGRDGIVLEGGGGMYWNPGNIDADPLFVDPDNGDFHLTEDSPCVDAGDPWFPRDSDGTRADMGAYFFEQGEGSPQIVVDPDALDFPIGENLQPEAELTIGNDGNRVLRFSTYEFEPNEDHQWIDEEDYRHWFDCEPRAGRIEPGEETNITVMIDARRMDLEFGHQRNLLILSNDPNAPVVAVNIHVHRTGVVWSEEAGFPDIMDWNAVYDEMELNHNYEIDFQIINISQNRLIVDEIRLDSPVFAVDQNGFELGPCESRGMTVTFCTAERGEFETTMFIISNSEENPEFPVLLHAEIPINPPDIRDNVNWWIALSAGVGNYYDDDNYVGGAEEATFDFDEAFDFPEPPRAPDHYIQLYFPHPEWENDLGDNFTSDIVPDDAQWETIIIWDFEVNTDQEDQAVTLSFDYNEDIDQNFNIVLLDIEAEESLDLWENDSYEYAAGEGGVHEFQLIYGDLVPPEVTVTEPNGGENLHPSDIVNITWEAEDLTGVAESVLYLSIDRGLNWTQIGSTEGEDFDLEWEVPDLYSPYCLIKVECTDVVENVGTDQSDDLFAITPQSSTYDFEAGWNLISIPLDPEDNSLEALFDDDIESQYHVYNYDQERGFMRVDEIDCGPGYWLGTYENASLDLEGTAYIDTVTFDLDQGWNLIGDPLLWHTPIDCVLFRADETTYSFTDAVDEGLVQPVLYNWLATNNNYTEEDELQSWLGYWFSVLAEDVQMLIYPVVPSEEGGRDNPDEATPEQWRLTITADIENTADLITTLGVDTNATDGFDVRYDYPEPPVPPSGDWITAYFRHEDWNPNLGRKFNRDIRAGLDYQDQVEWTMTVETSGEEAVTLRWPNIQETIPADYSIILEDPEADQTINMVEVDSYSYLSVGERHLTIGVTSFNAVKSDPYQGIPTELAIVSVHPNPFNAVTRIAYAVPTAGHVRLAVYDISGRLAGMLVDKDVSAGYYICEFDGGDLAAGLYFVRLEARGDVLIRKVIMVK